MESVPKACDYFPNQILSECSPFKKYHSMKKMVREKHVFSEIHAFIPVCLDGDIIAHTQFPSDWRLDEITNQNLASHLHRARKSPNKDVVASRVDWLKVKGKLKQIPDVSNHYTDQRLAFNWGSGVFLVKKHFSFGIRTVAPNTYHIYRMKEVPMLLFWKKTERFERENPAVFPAQEMFKYIMEVMPRNQHYAVEPGKSYVIQSVAKTLFAIDIVSVDGYNELVARGKLAKPVAPAAAPAEDPVAPAAAPAAKDPMIISGYVFVKPSPVYCPEGDNVPGFRKPSLKRSKKRQEGRPKLIVEPQPMPQPMQVMPQPMQVIVEPQEDDYTIEPQEDDYTIEPQEEPEDDYTIDPQEEPEDDYTIEPQEELENDCIMEPQEEPEDDRIMEPQEETEDDRIMEPQEETEDDRIMEPQEETEDYRILKNYLLNNPEHGQLMDMMIKNLNPGGVEITLVENPNPSDVEITLVDSMQPLDLCLKKEECETIVKKYVILNKFIKPDFYFKDLPPYSV